MPKAKYLHRQGGVDLDAEAFGARFNEGLVHECVRAELNAARQGTAATRSRGEVRGGGKAVDQLSPRELEVLAALARGRANKEIAGLLGISEETVKHHLTQIFNKTGVSTRLELALLATRRELVRSRDHARP